VNGYLATPFTPTDLRVRAVPADADAGKELKTDTG